MTGMDGISSLHKALQAMKVNDAPQVKDAAQVAGSGKALAAPATGATAGRADSATLSAAGGLAAQGVGSTSDVRLTKVAELRQAISSGTYNVPAKDVADKMVESLLN